MGESREALRKRKHRADRGRQMQEKNTRINAYYIDGALSRSVTRVRARVWYRLGINLTVKVAKLLGF